jgi:hypothetical protein
MAIEEILDSVRKIIYKWVDTSSRIQTDVTKGDTVISVGYALRFQIGDQVMLKNDTVYETGLVISEIDNINNLITLTTSVLNNWTVAENTFLVKTIYEQFVQGIYIGEPDVISHFPAITVNGSSRSSEWLTLESTKERYQIDIGVYVKASTHEQGYRFLLTITDIIQQGLKYNIMPLVNAYDLTSLTQDICAGDVTIWVKNRTLFNKYRRILIENKQDSVEDWITYIYPPDEDPSAEACRTMQPIPYNFDKSDTTVIVPHRFVFNSWPDNIEYGTIHKGELLKAAKISWFAEEEQMQWNRRSELDLG